MGYLSTRQSIQESDLPGRKSRSKKTSDLNPISMDSADNYLWSILQGDKLCGLHFRRNHPIGSYTAPYYCHLSHLAIEVTSDPPDTIVDLDPMTSHAMCQHGLHLIRINKDAIIHNPNAVMQSIRRLVESPSSRRTRGRSTDEPDVHTIH